jgi:hypothetical protein
MESNENPIATRLISNENQSTFVAMYGKNKIQITSHSFGQFIISITNCVFISDTPCQLNQYKTTQFYLSSEIAQKIGQFLLKDLQ